MHGDVVPALDQFAGAEDHIGLGAAQGPHFERPAVVGPGLVDKDDAGHRYALTQCGRIHRAAKSLSLRFFRRGGNKSAAPAVLPPETRWRRRWASSSGTAKAARAGAGS